MENRNKIEIFNTRNGISNPQCDIIEQGAGIIKELIRNYKEYQETKEHEITERRRIKACLQAVCAKIEADKTVMLAIINDSYSERQKVCDCAESIIKSALKSDDKEMLMIGADLLKYCTDMPINVDLINKYFNTNTYNIK